MRRARRLAGLALLASSLISACGDDRFPLEIYARQVVEAHCERATRCGQYRNVNTCIYELDPADVRLPAVVVRALNPAYAAAVGVGAARYDERTARACVEAIALASCDVAARDVRLDHDACTATFVGQIADGGPCGFDQECTSGRCTPAGICPDDYSCCVGTCASAPHTITLGAACQIDSDCAVDAFCSGAGCHALLARGESCSSSAQCDFDLICNRPSPTQAGECAPPPQLGEACPARVCASIGLVCGAAGACVALGLPTQPCANDFDCGPREVCEASHCALLPKLGEACTTLCELGAWCNLDKNRGTCDSPLANGMACAYAEQCASLFCADGDLAETCIDRPVCF